MRGLPISSLSTEHKGCSQQFCFLFFFYASHWVDTIISQTMLNYSFQRYKYVSDGSNSNHLEGNKKNSLFHNEAAKNQWVHISLPFFSLTCFRKSSKHRKAKPNYSQVQPRVVFPLFSISTAKDFFFTLKPKILQGTKSELVWRRLSYVTYSNSSFA